MDPPGHPNRCVPCQSNPTPRRADVWRPDTVLDCDVDCPLQRTSLCRAAWQARDAYSLWVYIMAVPQIRLRLLPQGAEIEATCQMPIYPPPRSELPWQQATSGKRVNAVLYINATRVYYMAWSTTMGTLSTTTLPNQTEHTVISWSIHCCCCFLWGYYWFSLVRSLKSPCVLICTYHMYSRWYYGISNTHASSICTPIDRN